MARPTRVWPARKPGSGQRTLPESERDGRLWRRELPNGMIVEEVGTPTPRLAGEPQPVLAKDAPEAPAVVPLEQPAEARSSAPTPSAVARLQNHRAITRDA